LDIKGGGEKDPETAGTHEQYPKYISEAMKEGPFGGKSGHEPMTMHATWERISKGKFSRQQKN